MQNFNLETLKEYRYERISSNKENTKLIKSFKNSKNEELELYLKRKAYSEDTQYENAHYVIKYKNNIVFYFSLKSTTLPILFSNKDKGISINEKFQKNQKKTLNILE